MYLSFNYNYKKRTYDKGMEYINILELIVSLTSRFSAVPYNFYDHIFILKIQQQLKAEYDKAVPEKWHIK